MKRARPYWFEIFAVANFIILDVVLRQIGFSAFSRLDDSFRQVGVAVVLQATIGIAVRAIISRRRGGDYLTVIRSARFWTDLGRIIVGTVLMAHIYGWLKVAVPALNPRLYDQFFWDLDRALFLGLSPNIFFLELFSHPLALRLVDWTYANVFMASLFVGGAFFLSAPDRGLRVGFINTNVTMWIVGAWLYVALPAFDPCYRFPELWLPLQQSLPQTQFLQGLLIRNYDNFQRVLSGTPAPVSLLLGLSAFPSLHVAYAFLVFLWMRRHSRAGRLFFALSTVIIFVGSMVTGWHYLADALAGLLLAVICYSAFRVQPPRFETHAPVDGVADHAR